MAKAAQWSLLSLTQKDFITESFVSKGKFSGHNVEYNAVRDLLSASRNHEDIQRDTASINQSRHQEKCPFVAYGRFTN